MSFDLRCMHCHEDRQIEVKYTPSKKMALIFCAVCGKSSQATDNVGLKCNVCQGIGSHHDDCSELRPWGV